MPFDCDSHSFSSVLLTVFNVGNYRREAVGAKQTSDFFNPLNKDAMQLRK